MTNERQRTRIHKMFLRVIVFLALASCAPHLELARWQRVDLVGPASSQQMPTMPTKLVTFDTTEGTRMNIDVSPDGTALVFDLLGDIYSLPIKGGDAVPLTTGRAWDQAPRFSPDGNSLFFVSDRQGHKNIWRLTLSDRSLGQVTYVNADVMGTPNWSQDGSRLVAGLGDTYTRNSEVTLHSIDPDTGHMMPLQKVDGPWINMNTYEHLRDRIVTFSGVQDGNGDVYGVEAKPKPDGTGTAVRIYKIDPTTQERAFITPADAPYNEFKPQLSHDGKLLSYLRQYPDRRTELRVLERDIGQDRALFQLSDADDASYYASHELWPNYAFTPDDKQIVFWQGGKIRQVRLDNGNSEIIPFHAKVEREVWARVRPGIQKIAEQGEAQIIRWPSVSDDGQTMVFASIGYIWVMDTQTGDMHRLTDGTDFEYMPSLSPDGKSIAYISFSQLGEGYGPGRLMLADVDGGLPRNVVVGGNETFVLPKWSADGKRIALIRETLTDNGLEAAVGWTDLADGIFRGVAKVPASDVFFARYIFSRFVSFDEDSNNLLYSFASSGQKTELLVADLDGNHTKTLAIGAPDVGGITPAPDLKHLILTRRDGSVWTMPFTANGQPAEISTSSTGARRVGGNRGYYVNWVGTDQITFGFGQRVYEYNLLSGVLESRSVKVTFDIPEAPQMMAFAGARLITLSGDNGTGRVIESGTIVVDGQRITAIGPDGHVVIPDRATLINLTGKTILPGLLDTHYHSLGGSIAGYAAQKLPNASFSDHSAIAYGVTAAWDAGGAPNDGVPATAELQLANRILGPRWSYANKGGVGGPYDRLADYAVAITAVEQHRLLGATVLKEYNAPTREQRQWLIAAAHEQGLAIVSHIDHFDGFLNRIVDGYTGGDHPYVPAPLYKDVQELLKQTGYIWTPNIVITSGVVGNDKDKDSYYWREVLKKRPNELAKLAMITGRGREIVEPTVPYEQHRVARVAKAAADAAKIGASIGVSAHNMPGSNLHQEMWYLWKGGMPIEDVLRATTMGNAAKLGLQEEIGSLEVGKIADFLVLDENPLDDIINTLSIKYTVQGGVVYDAATAQKVDLSRMTPTDTETIH